MIHILLNRQALLLSSQTFRKSKMKDWLLRSKTCEVPSCNFSHLSNSFSNFRYETILVVFSIVFAEAYPTKWQGKGKSRLLLSAIWSMVSMFIVFIYLCNLRSHLIKELEEVPPKSFKEFVLTKYSYRLHIWRQFEASPHGSSLIKQGRYVPIKGMLSKNLKARVCWINTLRLSSFKSTFN